MSGLVDKVDRLKDEHNEDMTEIKVDIAEIKSDVKHIDVKIDTAIKVFHDHVTGDNKIITHIEPILPHLASIAQMAEDHNFKRVKQQKRTDFLKSSRLKLGVLLTVVSIISIVYNLIG